MRGFFVGLFVGIVLTIGLGVFALAAVAHALAVEDPLEKGYAPLIVFSGAAIDPDP